MANSLLDFVMSLVRDPHAAAAYAADPAQAIADAHLVGVTSMDVSNLIPVVTESLSMSSPGIGADGTGADAAGNVWASGAATSAFDAFGDHAPASAGHSTPGSALDDAHAFAADVIDHPQDAIQVGADHLGVDTALEPVADHASPLLDPSAIDDLVADAPGPLDDWAGGVVEHIHPDTPDFDIFH